MDLIKKENMKKKKNIFLFILLLIVLLPVLLLELLIKSISKLIKKTTKRSKKFDDKEFYDSLSIEKVDIMDGIAFEQFLKRLFIYLGYQVADTARTGDFGADLVLKKDGLTTVVQAKRYNNNVGAKALQEIFSARHHYHADKMMVITNAHFTKQADVMADEQDIKLIDREELIAIMMEVKEEVLKNMSPQMYQEINTSNNEDVFENFKYRI